MKILIVVPSFKILGGVANHYEGLASYWSEDVTYIHYGRRPGIPAFITFLPDLLLFILNICLKKFDVIIVNPSLRPYQLIRDGLYLLVAKLLGNKVVTFIHGWDEKCANNIAKHPKLFCAIYGRSSFVYVLYSGFKEILDSLPWYVPILQTTTKVKDDLLAGFDISKRTGKVNTILFLARADRKKGLDVTIQAYHILKKRNDTLKLIVCGIGNALNEAKEYVIHHGIQDVIFKGHVTGFQVKNEFTNADVYVLPTYGEGMATSVLEAMAFGLPIITRPVGGVNDFFVEGKMGYLLESLQAEDFAEKIQYLIDQPDVAKQISRTNYEYANEHFMASAIAKKIEKDIKTFVNV